MPEIKHHFSGGKMNLDLDERLVPNGEYREAFNIQVSSSEGSNVGVLQNLLSNQKIEGQQSSVDQQMFTYNCIGSVADEKNDALYWFVRPNWYYVASSVPFFQAQFDNRNLGLNTDGLWQWKKYTAFPMPVGSYGFVVETTVGKDMILQYKGDTVEPVFVDQFEVICGVKDGRYIEPPLDNSNIPLANSELTLEIDSIAYNAINVGWNFSGYTFSQNFQGFNPYFIDATNDTIVVSSKYESSGLYYIKLKLETNSSTFNTFSNFINNILTHGIGPGGKIKALYFKNPKPATNFRNVRHITGVNVIDDMLFWTDDYNEPKKINIPRSLEGTSSNSNIHTRLINHSRNIDFLQNATSISEEHITVIKKSPNNPLALELITGREEKTYTNTNGDIVYEAFSGVITTGAANSILQTDDIISLDKYGDGTIYTGVQDLGGIIPGSIFKINVKKDSNGHDINNGDHIDFRWDVDDQIVLKEFDETNTDQPAVPISDYTIKAQILSLNTTNALSTPGAPLQVELRALAVNGSPATADINAGNATGELQYVVDKFDDEKNIFEFKYPRFGYRYKYEDGEYSHFSPFTQPAFVPGVFDYHPKKGYNLGMANRLQHIVVKNFKPDNIPLDVVEVDILYKDDSSPMIYVVDTIKPDAPKEFKKPAWANNNVIGISGLVNYWDLNAYKITDEQIKYILPENQLLRIYDNVPKKALAQDVTGNRIVYANYVQNFDLLQENGEAFEPVFNHFLQQYNQNYGNNIKDRSIKSLREYQLGVVFIDEFGRETPVLSNRTGTFKVPKSDSINNNRLSVGMKFEPPSGVYANLKYFKFFIKETSGQWYNMAMDRWYDAKDGNVWMSFPSSDRDKLTIDDFLILKKAAESDDAVLEHPARYKVLAIENEAPEYIKQTFTLVDFRSHNNTLFNTGIIDIPRGGVSTFELNYQLFYNSSVSNLHEQFLNRGVDDFYLQFEFAGGASKKYLISSLTSDIQFDITTGAPTNLVAAKYYVKTAETLGDDVNVILDDPQNLNPTKVQSNAQMRIFRMKPENKPEFDGKFFVKIFIDDIFEQYVKSGYNPEEDINYLLGPSIKLSYMNDQFHLMHEGNSGYGGAADAVFRDPSGYAYHGGTGFPGNNAVSALDDNKVAVPRVPYGPTDGGPGDFLTESKLRPATQYGISGSCRNAYSIAQYTGLEYDGDPIRLGLRHFAPFFRKYAHASDPTYINQTDTPAWAPEMEAHYYIPNSNTDGSIAWTGDIFGLDWFDPLYKFEYGTSGDDTKWREEYNRYTTIGYRSFLPWKWQGKYVSNPSHVSADASSPNFESWFLAMVPTNWNFITAVPNNYGWSSVSPVGSVYGLSEEDLVWDYWWRTDGYKKKSDSRARDTEVWYINDGYYTGKEYYTNDKRWGSTLYGSGSSHGLKIGGSTITLEITLGGLWAESKASMDGDTSTPMIDPGFFDIGKPGGNISYQDGPTMDIIQNLVPGSYCKFKEDPTGSIYQIVSVTEKNLYNYARYAKDDSGQNLSLVDPVSAAGTGFVNRPNSMEVFGSFAPILDDLTNWFKGDWYQFETDPTYAFGSGSGELYLWYDSHAHLGSHNDRMASGGGLSLNWDWGPSSAPYAAGYFWPAMADYISWSKNESHGSQLSCNYSKSYKISLLNVDAQNPTQVLWDPTGSNSSNFGPINNGIEIPITINEGTTNHIDLTTNKFTFTTTSIQNSEGQVLQKGMIVTGFDTTADGTYDISFDHNISSVADHSSKLYLQVVDIDEIDIAGAISYRIELGGYIRPLTVSDAYDFVADGIIKFQQAKMNGYSPNSVHKIKANMKNTPGAGVNIGTTGNTLEAVEYTLQFLRPSEDREAPLSTNPAIWETEPQDGPELDIYYEASPRIPIELNKETANDWIPTRYCFNPPDVTVTPTIYSYNSYSLGDGQRIHNPHGSYENSIIITKDPTVSGNNLAFAPPSVFGNDVGELEIVHVDGDILTLRCDSSEHKDSIIFAATDYGFVSGLIQDPPKTIQIRRPDGIVFSAEILAHNIDLSSGANPSATGNNPYVPATSQVQGGLLPYVSWNTGGIVNPYFGDGPENSFRIKINKNIYSTKASSSFVNMIDLNWHNCYSFGNGVESNRIRDNFNTPFISNGVRVSTTLSDYKQEHRQYGLIYSGIYNSISGVNNLNQFIQAEKITKDVNPIYGSIQKIHSRDSDLIALCEDKTLKILANKDAVFNADGNPQLTANINVLGQTIPFVGEYGISKNPESFASESYRAYFTDKVRGAVLRLSKDGLTPISNAGMKDWFRDNLKAADKKIIGSYDDTKQEYNVALSSNQDAAPWDSLANQVVKYNATKSSQGIVVTYDERVKGWVSFKSFGEMEEGLSMANDYYTFKYGVMWKHHSGPNSWNTFYSTPYNALVNVLINDEPSIIKSFKTIGYEGSQAKIPPHVSGSDEYDDFFPTTGWYSSQMNTNIENGSLVYFVEKESKWFSRIKGDDNSELDNSSFSSQGIGRVGIITL